MSTWTERVPWRSRVERVLRRPVPGDSPRIGLISASNGGNLGDAALLQAVIDEIRSRWQPATVCVFTLNPVDAASRHGVPSYPIAGGSRGDYRLTGKLISSRVLRFQEYLSRVPLIGRLLRRCWDLLRLLLAEVAHTHATLVRVRQLDVLVVAGGTQIDDSRTGAWGHPFTLYKLGLLARLTRTHLVILSVGAGTARSWLSRFFLRATLNRASYRSFRDARSAQLAQKLTGTEGEQVVPDLVLSRIRPLRRAFPRDGVRLTVGVSPVSHGDPRADRTRDPEKYWHLMRTYAAFISWLAEQGHTVILFATDPADRNALSDVQHRLRPDTLARHGTRIQHAYVETVYELTAELSRMDCVIASRQATISLTHVLGLPVLALAHEPGVLAHMNDMRQIRHCLEIDNLETEDLKYVFTDLNAWLPEAAATVYGAMAMSRRAVVAQYDLVFRLTGWARERARVATPATPALNLPSTDPAGRL